MQQNRGYIIINGFLREEKFFSLYSALKQREATAGLQKLLLILASRSL